MGQPSDVDVDVTRLVVIRKFGELIAEFFKDLGVADTNEAMAEAVGGFIENVNHYFGGYATNTAKSWEKASNPGRTIYCPECRDYREPMDCPDVNPDATCAGGAGTKE